MIKYLQIIIVLIFIQYLEIQNAHAQSAGNGFTPSSISLAANLSVPTGSIEPVIADINRDGKNDILTINPSEASLYIFYNTGSQGQINFAPVTIVSIPGTSVTPRGIAVGDLNGDLWPDIAIAGGNSDKVHVLLNASTVPGSAEAQFNFSSYSTGNTPYSVNIADLNADTYPDLAVANYGSSSVSLFKNQGNGIFLARQDIALPSTANFYVTSGKLNADLLPDLIVVSYYYAKMYVLPNTSGSGTFSFGTTQSLNTQTNPRQASLGDLNQDGKTDIITAGNLGSAKDLWVFLNQSTATGISLAPKQNIPTGSASQPVSAHIRDMDLDGRNDIIWSSESGHIGITKNLSAAGVFNYGSIMPTFSTGSTTRVLTSADLDLDNLPDIVVSNQGSPFLSVYQNKMNVAGTVPAKPAGFTASALSRKVNLSWQANSETTLYGYKLYYGTSPNPATSIRLTGNSHSFTGLTNATTYYYRLAAIDVAGNESEATEEISVTPMPQPQTISWTTLPASVTYGDTGYLNLTSSSNSGTNPTYSIISQSPNDTSAPYMLQLAHSFWNWTLWINKAGTAVLRVSYPGNTDFLPGYIDVPFTVNRKEITASFNDVISPIVKEYDGTTVGYPGFWAFEPDIWTYDQIYVKCESATYDSKDAGSRMVHAEGLTLYGKDAPNYLLTTTTLDGPAGYIHKKGLSIDLDDKIKMVGEPNPPFTYRLSGFVAGEDPVSAGITGEPEFITEADINSPAGYYLFEAREGTLTSPNYYISNNFGTLQVIAPSSQSITFDPVSDKTYGDAPFELSAVASSGLPVSFASSDPTVATINGSKLTILKAGQVTITASQAGNVYYGPAATVSQTLTVAQKVITVSLTGEVTKMYDGSSAASVASVNLELNGALPSDDISIHAGTTSFDNKNAGTGKTVTVTGLTLAGNDSENYTLAANTVSAPIGTISPKTLTVKADDQSRSFGQADPAFTFVISGFIDGETAASAVTGAPVLSTTATAASPAGTYPIQVNQGTLSADNYTFSTEPGSLSVGKAAQSIVFAPLADKTYGDAPIELSAAASSGLPVSFTTNDPAIASISGNTLTLRKPGSVTITASQPGDPNYDPAAVVSQTFTIAKKTLTVSLTGEVTKMYDGSSAASVASVNLELNGALPSDDISIHAGTTSFDNKNAGTGKTVTVTGLTLAGNDSGNYTLAAGTVSAPAGTINPKTLTVKADDQSRSFGQADPAFTFVISGFIDGETVASVVSGAPVLSTTATPDSQAGTYPIQVNQGTLAADNYTFSTVPGSLTVGKAAQNIVFAPLADKTYGDAPFELSAAASSGLPVSFTTNDPAIASISGNTLTLLKPGSVTITASQPGDLNYDPATAVSQSFTIAKKTLTVSLTGEVTKMYDGSSAASVASVNLELNGALPQDDISIHAGTASFDNKNAGTGKNVTVTGLTLAGNDSENYTLAANTVSAPIGTISPKTLTVKADDQSRSFGQADPAFTFTIRGFIEGETAASAVTGAPVLSTTATAASPAGTYPIQVNQGTLSADNYTFSTEPGSLSVGKAAQSIVFAPLADKTYGDAPIELSAAASSGLPVSFTTNDPAIASISGNTLTLLKPGTVTITASQPGDANYDPATAVSQTFTIAKKTLTASLTGEIAKVYDGSPAASVASSNLELNGVLPSDDISIHAGTASFDNKNAGTGKTVTVTGLTLAGNDSENYTLAANTVSAPIGTISPKTLTVKADDQSRSFGQADPTFTFSISGFSDGETPASAVTGAPVLSTTATAASPAGTYPIQVNQGTLAADNYTFSTEPGSLSVGKAAQSIVFAPLADKIYGDAPIELSAAASSGLPVGFTTNDPAIASISGNTLTLLKPGTVTITASQPGDANYNPAAGVSQTFIIAKKPLTISLTGTVSKEYNGNAGAVLTPANYQLDGVLPGEEVHLRAATTNFEDKNAGLNKIVFVTGLQLEGTAAENYVLGASGMSGAIGTITPKSLIIRADDKSRNAGDPDPVFTYTISGWLPGEEQDLNTLPALHCQATIQSPPGNYSIEINPMEISPANYSWDYRPGTLTIVSAGDQIKASQSISFEPVAGKEYGDTPFRLKATASSGLPVTFTSMDPTIARIDQNNLVTILRPGTAVIRASQAGNAFYEAAKDVEQMLVIDKRGLTAALIGEVTKTYDASNEAIIARSNFSLGRIINGDEVFIDFTKGTYNNPLSGRDKTVKANGLGLSGKDSYKYRLLDDELEACIGIIKKKQLLVTADNKTRFPSENNPALTFRMHGFVANETEKTATSGQPTLFTTATSGSPAGNYPINIKEGTLKSPNYDLTFVDGILTVKQAPQAIVFPQLPVLTTNKGTLDGPANASSGLPVTYHSSNPEVAVIENNKIKIIGFGKVIITASQPGDSFFLPATEVSQELIVESDELIPSHALTPNGDNIHDVWEVKNIEKYPDSEVIIINRLGQIVYKAKGYKNDWNGTFNGSFLPNDTYYFKIIPGRPGMQAISSYITLILN